MIRENLKPLKCPTCGGKVVKQPNGEYECEYCGNTYVLNESSVRDKLMKAKAKYSSIKEEINSCENGDYCVYDYNDNCISCFNDEDEAIDFAINNDGDYVTGPAYGLEGRAVKIWDRIDYEDEIECEWCGDRFDKSDLINTDVGHICNNCYAAIKSHGEPLIVYDDEYTGYMDDEITEGILNKIGRKIDDATDTVIDKAWDAKDAVANKVQTVKNKLGKQSKEKPTAKQKTQAKLDAVKKKADRDFTPEPDAAPKSTNKYSHEYFANLEKDRAARAANQREIDRNAAYNKKYPQNDYPYRDSL